MVVIGGPVAKGLDPPRGTIKVTVNVTGRTTDEVHERIEGRLSSARSESEPSTDSAKGTSQPVTVALTGIDESSQPEALLHTVVKPLVDAGTEMELRFSDESSPGLGLAQQWLREEISSRLATLTTRVEEIDAAETALRARRSDIATRVSPVPDIPSTTRIWGSGSVPSGARGSIRRGSVPRWPRPSARPSGPPALSNG